MRSSDGAGLRVELAWVEADGTVTVRPMRLPAGSTLGDALAAIEAPALREALVAGKLAAAVFGEAKPADAPLSDGDRIELLEGLKVDPKAARRRRAEVRRAQAAARNR